MIKSFEMLKKTELQFDSNNSNLLKNVTQSFKIG